MQPSWLKRQIILDSGVDITNRVIKEFGLNTVCYSARCPNIFECFSKKRATFLILGNCCSRNCGFCSIARGRPQAVDEEEPSKIAEALLLLGLRRVVITSVTRDDMADGGSGHFKKTIETIRRVVGRDISIEVLVPDFRGADKAIARVIEAGPDIFGHNIETVPGLYAGIRPFSDYARSIGVLRRVKQICPTMATKSSLMLGLGETESEVVSVMKDLRQASCDMLALGQYLRPSPAQVEVREFLSPQAFLRFKEIAYSLGFKDVQSAPLVRSSYREG